MRAIILLLLAMSMTAFAQIKAVVFDYGGVIATHVDEPLIAFFEEVFQVSRSEAEEILHTRGWKTREKPENWDESFHAAVTNCMRITPGIFDLVAELKSQDYCVALFSNISKGVAMHLRQMGHYEVFNPLFLSYEMELEKPHPEAYLKFLEGMPCNPDEIVFIDDRIENVEAARLFGIHALHFTSMPQLLSDLEELNVL